MIIRDTDPAASAAPSAPAANLAGTADGNRAATEAGWNAALAAQAGKDRPADPGLSLWETAADLSATAGDIAAALAEDRACPAHVARARRLLAILTDSIGDGTAA